MTDKEDYLTEDLLVNNTKYCCISKINIQNEPKTQVKDIVWIK